MPVLPWTEEKRTEIEAVIVDLAPAPPEVVNVQAALDLGAAREIDYGGVQYLVLPVPFPEGVRLQEVLRRLRVVRETEDPAEAEDALLDALVEAVAICGRLVRPTGWRRLPWALGLRPNPFRNASEADLAALLALFWTARTRRTLRPASGPRRGAARRRST